MKIIEDGESKKKETERNKRVVQTIVKGWKLNDFAVRLS